MITGPLLRPLCVPVVGAAKDAPQPPTWILQTEEGVPIFTEEGATIQLESLIA